VRKRRADKVSGGPSARRGEDLRRLLARHPQRPEAPQEPDDRLAQPGRPHLEIIGGHVERELDRLARGRRWRRRGRWRNHLRRRRDRLRRRWMETVELERRPVCRRDVLGLIGVDRQEHREKRRELTLRRHAMPKRPRSWASSRPLSLWIRYGIERPYSRVSSDATWGVSSASRIKRGRWRVICDRSIGA